MIKIPKFRLFGKDDPKIEEKIQPKLNLRSWDSLLISEKAIALQELINSGYVDEYSSEMLNSIEHLNHHFLRLCPGKALHAIPPKRDVYGYDNRVERMQAALKDFRNIFLNEKAEAVIFRMITIFAENFIDSFNYKNAEKEADEDKRAEYLQKAFIKFDRLANCLNHIFEQFAVNAHLTREGLVPKQDKKITKEIYEPVLRVLSDPKWKSVSDLLAGMFSDFQQKDYPECITKAHSVLQRFLQILVGEEGGNGKGELGKLFAKAKVDGVIPSDGFTERIITVFQGFISDERAAKSTAKPARKKADSSDALLVMNIIMVFLQYCIQNPRNT